jgi:hypothetical protein
MFCYLALDINYDKNLDLIDQIIDSLNLKDN